MRLLWSALASLSSGRVLYQDRTTRRRLFLTFDDGPSRKHTPEVLDVLGEHGVQATFFMVGKHAIEDRDIVRDVVARGHEVGNHSMNHPHFARITPEKRLEEMDKGDRALTEAGAPGPFIFRLPYGDDAREIVTGVTSTGRRLALWSRDSMDYQCTAPQVVGEFDRKPVSPGDVVLFHDDGPVAAEALRILVPRWLDDGFTFHCLSSLVSTQYSSPAWEKAV